MVGMDTEGTKDFSAGGSGGANFIKPFFGRSDIDHAQHTGSLGACAHTIAVIGECGIVEVAMTIDEHLYVAGSTYLGNTPSGVGNGVPGLRGWAKLASMR